MREEEERRVSQKREKRTMHQKRTRPETMPAHKQTWRVIDKHMDRHALGFWAP